MLVFQNAGVRIAHNPINMGLNCFLNSFIGRYFMVTYFGNRIYSIHLVAREVFFSTVIFFEIFLLHRKLLAIAGFFINYFSGRGRTVEILVLNQKDLH